MENPGPLVFGSQTCGALGEGASREWLLPDGRGGYAMGTVSGLRTRRYHALLVVADDSGPTRRVGLVSLDPVLVLASGDEVRLGTHEWASGAVVPEGYQLLASFALADGLPRWRWRVGAVVVERELAMVHGRSALGVVTRLVAGGPATLRLEAVCTWRDAHGERFAGGGRGGGDSAGGGGDSGADGDLRMTPASDGVVIEGAYRLAGPGWEPSGTWWRNAWLREEAARGLGAREDLWFAGSFSAKLQAGEAIEVSAWADDLDAAPPPASSVVAAAGERARALMSRALDETSARLRLAADAFIIQRKDSAAPDVIAGYPWFGAWSRDTMLSYDGLFLTTGRADEGRELLRAYAATLSEGMLANTADTGGLEYNTADGTLWFVHAIGRHVAVTGDVDLAAELRTPIESVIQAHIAGTRYGIRVGAADSQLRQGADGTALTWMDARIDGVPVTARRGAAVEIAALWINALGTAREIRERVGMDGTMLGQRFGAAATAFRRRFPAPGGGLHDVVDGGCGDDPSPRPNQLLAYSLPHGPMRGEPPPLAVARDLLTPLGLRTLAASDPRFRPRHRGTAAARDAAYHQGTVWPWLIGPYHDAVAASRGGADGLLDGLAAHLGEAGLGSVSETCDGAAPHGATGCPFQAWSVAETGRVWNAGAGGH